MNTEAAASGEVGGCALRGERSAERPPLTSGFARLAVHPVALLFGLGILAFATSLATRWQLPLPFCALRKLTGIPCPACGSTRSLLAWTHLDPVAAFLFNPLFFLACIGVAAWAGAWLYERISARPVLNRWRSIACQWPVLRIFLSLTAINWVYLCLTLPK